MGSFEQYIKGYIDINKNVTKDLHKSDTKSIDKDKEINYINNTKKSTTLTGDITMTNNEITNLLKPAFKWAKSCGANHFESAFRLSPQFTNFCNTGTLMTIIFGKKFYWMNGYFIKKVENSSNGNIITELMDRTGVVIGSYIETDLPVMNHKV